MATQVAEDTNLGVSTLLGGIVQDARRLITEQLTLFQVEIKHDVNRTIRAVIPLVGGALLLLPGFLLLGTAAALGICDAFNLPLWAGFLILGSIFAVVAAIGIAWGATALKSVHLTPDTALTALKENLQWKTKT